MKDITWKMDFPVKDENWMSEENVAEENFCSKVNADTTIYTFLGVGYTCQYLIGFALNDKIAYFLYIWSFVFKCYTGIATCIRNMISKIMCYTGIGFGIVITISETMCDTGIPARIEIRISDRIFDFRIL